MRFGLCRKSTLYRLSSITRRAGCRHNGLQIPGLLPPITRSHPPPPPPPLLLLPLLYRSPLVDIPCLCVYSWRRVEVVNVSASSSSSSLPFIIASLRRQDSTRLHRAGGGRSSGLREVAGIVSISVRSLLRPITSPPGEVRSIAMSMSVSLFVCLSVCPLAYLRNRTAELRRIFCAC